MSAKSVQTAEPSPAVSDGDAIDDSTWFDQHPHRRFRVRRVPGGYAVIRHTTSGVFLRTFAGADTAIADAASDLAILWFSCAYPSAHPEQVRKRALKALKQGGKK
jgi:hypothetical protein